MKDVLKLEEFGMFCLSIILYNMLGYSWWLYAVLILTPDISMIGYLFNPIIGGVSYNVFHHKGIAIILYLIGTFTYNYVL